jgi:hypothetical protein
MKDLENELREALEEDARRAPVPTEPPRQVLRRTRRRQIVNVAIGAVTAVAVIGGSFVGLRAFLSADGVRPGAPGSQTRTSTVLGGVTITYPKDWYLLKLGGTFEQTRTRALFQLSNFDPLHDNGWVCPLPRGEIPNGSVVLYVQELIGPREPGSPPPSWPVDLDGPRHDLGLGCGVFEHYAAWTADGGVYEAFLTGAPGPAFDRLLEGFRGMEFDRRFEPGEAPVGPEYVLDSGRVAGRRWMLSADAHRPEGPETVCLGFEAFGPRGGSAKSGCDVGLESGAAIAVSESMVVRGPDASVVGFLWGVVSPRATDVSARLVGGGTVRGKIVAFPPSFGVELRAFLLELTPGSTGEIVALEAGRELQAVAFTLPEAAGSS